MLECDQLISLDVTEYATTLRGFLLCPIGTPSLLEIALWSTLYYVYFRSWSFLHFTLFQPPFVFILRCSPKIVMLLCFLLPFFASSLISALCYAPDGSLSPGDGYLPCITTINVDSMCCVLNITALELIGKSAADGDTCLPNGMCQNLGNYAREYCTDKTWKSPNCLNICTGGSVSLLNLIH